MAAAGTVSTKPVTDSLEGVKLDARWAIMETDVTKVCLYCFVLF